MKKAGHVGKVLSPHGWQKHKRRIERERNVTRDSVCLHSFDLFTPADGPNGVVLSTAEVVLLLLH